MSSPTPGTAPSPTSPPPSNSSSPPPASASPPPAPTHPPPPPPPPPPPSSPTPPSSSSPPPPSSSSPPPPSSSSPPPPPSSSSPPPPSSSSPPPPPSSSSPPPPATPAPPPPPRPPPPPHSSTPSPPAPSTPPPSTSPPPPPSSSPSPPSGSSPSPPSRGNTPPSNGRSLPAPRGSTLPPSSSTPTRPSSSPNNGGGGGDGGGGRGGHGGGISTGLAVGIAVAGVAILAILTTLFICCKKKKQRRPNGHVDNCGRPPSGPKDDPYGGPVYHWQHNAPPPGDHVVTMPPKVSPQTAWASRPPHSPACAPQPPPAPPGYISSTGGSGSNCSGSENPLPPPSPGSSLGYSKSIFTYEELAMATDGFSDANLLGQGGFGYVHRGVLPNGKVVAVKQLKAGSGQGEREFQAEVEIISRVHHKHLVSLVGYCITGTQRMLVYEFVPNNTLGVHLHGKGRAPIDWPTRMKIAVGSAKGLAYLHEDCHPKIIHRDIKTANILLDFNFEAKVADFGLAKFSSDVNTHVSTRVMGTFGYLAPEYASSGKLSDKSDVFSFGVVLLELITGRQPVASRQSLMDDSLVDWARPRLTPALDEKNFGELVDLRLQIDYDDNEMARVVACAAACVRHSARRRPRMSLVVKVLEGDVSLTDLHEGIRPGQSSVYSSHGSSDYDADQQNEERKKLLKTALASQVYDGNSEYSGRTSEYGLHPSDSSSEGQKTRETSMGKMKADSREDSAPAPAPAPAPALDN